MNKAIVLPAIAVLAFALFLALGAYVSKAPPSAFDLSMLGTYGVGVPVARVFTAMGRFPVYFVLCLLSVVFVAFRRAWAQRAALAVVGLIVVWQTSDIFKALFHRPRPLHPILAETSFGYPSGHADLSVFFYGLWTWYVWQAASQKTTRFVCIAVSIGLIVAIGWSRLSLGAHFPSDVIGGYLYGTVWLAVAITIGRVRSKSRA